jgi:acetyl-CoA carboxylase alpha subunit
VKAQILAWLGELSALSTDELLEQRFRKFRGMGVPQGA